MSQSLALAPAVAVPHQSSSSCCNVSPVFRAASYLTDTFCNVHEYYHRLSIVEKLNPGAAKVEIWARKALLCLGILVNGALALICVPLGLALRYIGKALQNQPFTHVKGDVEATPVDGNLKLVTWNVCMTFAGYSITDGGVLPWHLNARSENVIQQIRNQNADVLALYEVSDINIALHLCERLKDLYSDFYFNMGPQGIGPNSMMFVASRKQIASFEYTSFQEGLIYGRESSAIGKGFCTIDLPQREGFVRLISTHMQHSEIPSEPTDEERRVRTGQMQTIARKTQEVAGRVAIVTGDLNLDREEFEASSWKNGFWRGRITNGEWNPTWGGDQFCAGYMGKHPSEARTLDYTLISNGEHGAELQTTIHDAGFRGDQFNINALSDHSMLVSTVQFRV